MHKIGSNLKYFVFISYVNKYNEMYELRSDKRWTNFVSYFVVIRDCCFCC